MFGKTLLAGILALTSSAASAALLTFDTNINPNGSFEQGLGDIANLDVANATLGAFSGAAIASYLVHETSGYGDLTDIARGAAPHSVGSLTFSPDAGYEVTISSFDVGAWTAYGNQRFVIYDENYNALWGVQSDTAAFGHLTFTPNVTFAGTVHLQWGFNYYMGIDNLTYSVAPTGAVPLPAGLPLLVGALLALPLVRRGRRVA